MDLFTWNTILKSNKCRPKKSTVSRRPKPKPITRKIAPFIGINGNWFIDGKDTHIYAFPEDYNKLLNRPTLNNETIEGNLEALPLTLEEILDIIQEVEDELEP